METKQLLFRKFFFYFLGRKEAKSDEFSENGMHFLFPHPTLSLDPLVIPLTLGNAGRSCPALPHFMIAATVNIKVRCHLDFGFSIVSG